MPTKAHPFEIYEMSKSRRRRKSRGLGILLVLVVLAASGAALYGYLKERTPVTATAPVAEKGR